MLLGYEQGSKAYRVFDPVQSRLYVTRDIVFDEDRKWNWENKGGEQDFVDKFTVVYSDLPVTATVPGSVGNRQSKSV